MKRMILIFIGWLCMLSTFGQTNYYTESKVFSEYGYNYQAVLGAGRVELYNQDNQWIGGHPTYKSNGEIFSQPEYGYIELYDHDSWLNSEEKMGTIVWNALTIKEREMVKGDELNIILHINSTTGKVGDVMFNFVTWESFAKIPVSTYRKIELEIKEKLLYNLTDDGKKLNYIYTWNSIEF